MGHFWGDGYEEGRELGRDRHEADIAELEVENKRLRELVMELRPFITKCFGEYECEHKYECPRYKSGECLESPLVGGARCWYLAHVRELGIETDYDD